MGGLGIKFFSKSRWMPYYLFLVDPAVEAKGIVKIAGDGLGIASYAAE